MYEKNQIKKNIQNGKNKNSNVKKIILKKIKRTIQ